MKVTLYLADKDRERELGEALSAGFQRHGDEVETILTQHYVQPKGDTQVAVMVGVKGRSKKVFEDHRRAARHTLLIDKSYFGRGDYYRVSLDGFQPRYAHETQRPSDRFDRLGVKLKPQRRDSGGTIIYAGSSQKYCDWHDLGDASEFANGVCFAVNKYTHSKYRMLYRPKPSWAAGHPDEVKLIPDTVFSPPSETLAQLLPYCRLLVTHGSNAGVEAIAAGVPVFLVSNEGASAVWPLAEKDPAKIETPFFPSDDLRRRVFCNLAYCQFTSDEIRSGLMWETLIPHTAKGLGNLDGMNDADRCVELYKMMHRGAKMFRGNSLKGHWEAVKGLVDKYGPATLLDYGSGKGAQYDELHLHERWGGIKPVCYDPGYPPFENKPSGTFAGVICTDVAEHIPESGVDDFLRDVTGYAEKFAFFCIFTEPSRKFLPDGRNCHVTVRPPEWWLDRVAQATGATLASEYMVRKPLPGGAFEDFPYYVLTRPGKADIVVTFRGGD